MSEEDDARLVIEREGVVVVVNAYVWEMAAAHAAMVRADVFMVVSVLFCRVTALLHQLNAKIYSVLQELALAVDMFVELKIFFETWKCKTVWARRARQFGRIPPIFVTGHLSQNGDADRREQGKNLLTYFQKRNRHSQPRHTNSSTHKTSQP